MPGESCSARRYNAENRSLDHIYRSNGPLPIDMVGKVAEAVLKGLVYLYDVHRIIHRGEVSHRVSCQRLMNRYKAFQYPREFRWRDQTGRLWCLWRTDQFHCKHFCRYEHVYECESSRLQGVYSSCLSLKESRERRIRSNRTFGHLASPLSSYHLADSHFQIQKKNTTRIRHYHCPTKRIRPKMDRQGITV